MSAIGKNEKTFDLSKFADVDCQSFALRRLVGDNELDALARVVPPTSSGASQSPLVTRTLHSEAVIAASIVAIDGERVGPGVDKIFRGWTLRTREFVTAAYNRFNGAQARELEDFIKTHFGEEPSGATASSSGSGSGAPGI